MGAGSFGACPQLVPRSSGNDKSLHSITATHCLYLAAITSGPQPLQGGVVEGCRTSPLPPVGTQWAWQCFTSATSMTVWYWGLLPIIHHGTPLFPLICRHTCTPDRSGLGGHFDPSIQAID